MGDSPGEKRRLGEYVRLATLLPSIQRQGYNGFDPEASPYPPFERYGLNWISRERV